MVYVPKLYHFCPYRCKFATVQTEMVNRNIVFNSAFSLLSLLVFIFSLILTSNPASSHIRPSSSLNKERTKCRSRWRSVLGHGGDRFWVWVTVEIVFEGHDGDRFWVWVTVEIVFEIGFGF